MFKLNNSEISKLKKAVYSELYLTENGEIKGSVPIVNWKEWVAGSQRDTLAIEEEDIDITFDYPIEKPFKEHFRSDGGFTLGKLTQIIGQTYEKIYFEPEEYGVYGHGVEDLVIEGINKEGDGFYTLSIGS